jgi:hypothetical protein
MHSGRADSFVPNFDQYFLSPSSGRPLVVTAFPDAGIVDGRVTAV